MKLAFLIGCGEYDDPNIAPLRFADKDADCFANVIASSCGLADDEIKLLSTNKKTSRFKPTKSNIIRELSSGLSSLNVPYDIDLLFFFFSGHGFHSLQDNRDYLVPQDAVLSGLEDTALSFGSIIKYLRAWRAKNTVLLIDACRAVIQGGKDIVVESWNSINVECLNATGMASFLSCSPNQKSYEGEDLQNGIFTFVLCEALSDKAKCKTIYELDNYLVQTVPQVCRRSEKPIQNPYTRVEPLSIKDVILISEKRLAEWRSLTPIGQEIRSSRVQRLAEHSGLRKGFTCAIDFGTTFSTVAILDDDSRTRLIPSPQQKKLIPSVISFLSNLDYLIGWEALENAKTFPQNTVYNVKRYLGSNKIFNIHGRSLSPEFVASLIIKSLKRNAEEFLACSLNSAIIATPANFNIVQSNALVRACELADLNIYRVIGEPCAAAILLEETMTHSPEIEFVLVLDLGGGTFDVSIIEIGEGVIETKAIAGDNYLGGIDYDEALCEYIATTIQSRINSEGYNIGDVLRSQIRAEAERAKIVLGSKSEASIILQNLEIDESGLSNLEISITRDLFRELTIHLEHKIEKCIQQVLRLAGIEPYQLHMALLAGQGTKIFAVRETIEKLLPELRIETRYQESAVVQGICKYTGVIDGINRSLLLIDSNYTAITTECMTVIETKERFFDPSVEEYFIISGNEKQNNLSYDLVPLGSAVPRVIYRGVGFRDATDGKIRLKITEKSNLEEINNSVLGSICIEVDKEEGQFEIVMDCDVSRTIVMWIKNPSKREILGFQLTNLYYPSTSFVPPRENSLVASMVGWTTKGYTIHPVKRLDQA
ncbi:MAG TPA: Hsp70 family protein [Blastocatellia bacterium]|nr:Hsp70 family protein [Blastocatellia bacterium]